MSLPGSLKVPRPPEVPLALLICALPILVATVALAATIPPGPDLLWRLHLAGRMLDGLVLYRDLIEVNPPLWFWTALPAVWLGKLMQVPAYQVLIGFNLLLASLCVGLLYVLLRATVAKFVATCVSLAFLAGLCLIPVGDWGQREQALLAACGLWTALVALRAQGKAVPWQIAVLVGLIGAYGFALKHYFVLIPLVLEIWLVARQKRVSSLFRPETWTLGGAACLYAILVAVFAPDFLTRVLGLVAASYDAYGPLSRLSPLDRLLRLLSQCSFILSPILALILTRQRHPLAMAFLLAAVTSVVIVVLQEKGWRYHAIAAQGLSVMILALSLALAQQTGARWLHLVLICCLGLQTVWFELLRPMHQRILSGGQPVSPVMAQFLKAEPADSRIFILSTAPDLAYYPLARAGRTYWSRHYSMWMLPGLLTPSPDPRREAIRQAELRRVRAEFVADVTCSGPDVIVGELGYLRKPKRQVFDAVGFLSEDLRFKAWLATHYVRSKPAGRYPVWRRVGERPASCLSVPD